MKNSFYKLRISDKIFLTSDAILLKFDLPLNLQLEFTFLPGQYITLRSVIDGVDYRRSYSICTIPNENYFSIVVKVVKEGVFSNFVKNIIRIGDFLEVSLPNGRFYYQNLDDDKRKIFLIAAGSGITPIFSIIKNVLFNEKLSSITLLYANKTIEDTIFFNEIEDLSNQFKDRFEVIQIFSRINYHNKHFGKIDDVFLNENINQRYGLGNFSEFYNCGPENLIKNVQDYLLSIGILQKNIKTELFYSLKNELAQANFDDENYTLKNVEVILNQQRYFTTVKGNKNLLESLLNEGIDIPYSCKQGNCSSCVGKVISGTVNMKNTSILMSDEIQQGYILACQSELTSDTLVISFDEY